MRYTNDETTVLGGFFKSDSQVTIKVLNKYGQAVQLVTTACSVSPDEDNLYLWDTSNMQAEAGSYFYVMTDGVHKRPGKFVYGGYVDSISEINDKSDSIASLIDANTTIISDSIAASGVDVRSIIEDIQLGSWEIHDTEMIMRSINGEELARFALYDQYGQPNAKSVFKRIRQ